MTPRQRLLATLRGDLADRVPVAPFVQEEYLSFYYPHKTRLDRVIDAVVLADELDFDLMAKPRELEQPHFFRRSYPNWELSRTQSRSDGMIRQRLTIATPSHTLMQEETGPDSGAATSGVRFQVTRTLLQDADDAAGVFEVLAVAQRGRQVRDVATLPHRGDRSSATAEFWHRGVLPASSIFVPIFAAWIIFTSRRRGRVALPGADGRCGRRDGRLHCRTRRNGDRLRRHPGPHGGRRDDRAGFLPPLCPTV